MKAFYINSDAYAVFDFYYCKKIIYFSSQYFLNNYSRLMVSLILYNNFNFNCKYVKKKLLNYLRLHHARCTVRIANAMMT
jgi:hypothetical protein